MTIDIDKARNIVYNARTSIVAVNTKGLTEEEFYEFYRKVTEALGFKQPHDDDEIEAEKFYEDYSDILIARDREFACFSNVNSILTYKEFLVNEEYQLNKIYGMF